jgi:acyl-CoA thioester hydrolase
MSEDYIVDVPVRFRDLDPMGHVNNAVYASYLEQARVAYFDEVVGERLDEVDTVLASMTIEYRRSIELEDDVSIALSIVDTGTSSITMEYEIRTDEEIAATAETVQVVIDRDTETSRPIPDEWRERIERASS